MDNTEAVEKLAKVLNAAAFDKTPYQGYYGMKPKGQTKEKFDAQWWDGNAKQRNFARRRATKVLAAIQADPLAYVKPKPIVWRQTKKKGGGFHAQWWGDTATCKYGTWQMPHGLNAGEWYLVGRDETSFHPTLEAAQAAAYDDLCNRVGELF